MRRPRQDSGAGCETGGICRDSASRKLHSRYNPQAEAERYIDALALPKGIRYFILVEPGLGYTIPVLARRFPEAGIFALHTEDPRLFGPAYQGTGKASVWSPESGAGLEDFLEREIPDTRASTLRILEWRPSLNYYRERYLRILSTAAEFVKRSDANSRTVSNFGRRWFRNFLRNQRLLGSFPVFGRLSLPALIAGAGPSLEEAIPQIRRLREEGCFVIAPSSSVMALAAGGLTPDLILSTDGGGWALLHLYECLRSAAPVIAASLGAALPSQCGSLPLLPLSDGSLWQRLVLETLGMPRLALPQRGTVTASALDLAFALGAKEACLAGMDLGLRDIRSHARPYSFDRLLSGQACRFRPGYSQAFTRSFGIDGGGNHRIYAAWFKGQLESWKGRLYTLGNNNPVFQELKPWHGNTLSDPPQGQEQGKPEFRLITRPVPDNPAGIALDCLLAALEDPRTAGPLYRELAPLLLPDFLPDSDSLSGEQDGVRALAAEMERLARPYLERNRG
jgi:hypothetical protein